MTGKLSFALALISSLAFLGTSPDSSAAPVGGFLVHMNGNRSNSDSRRSVTFYDADSIAGGPLFSVALPMEFFTEDAELLASNDYEETTSITVDPLTGDIYVVSFDNVIAGGMIGDEAHATTPYSDTTGDFDIYKINFASAYNHWASTYEGHVAADLLGVDGTTPKGVNNQNNADYVTYGIGPRTAAGEFNPQHTGSSAHANTVVLANVVEKVGEVNRNNPGSFYNPSLSFVRDDLMLLIDNRVVTSPTVLAEDNSYRSLTRVATTPGAATTNGVDGGYNRGTTESWTSTKIGPVGLNPGGPPSLVESSDYYENAAAGVRGLWVTAQRTGGDSLAFFQVDSAGAAIGYRPFALPGDPTQIFLKNDPNDEPAANNFGKADNVFVDSDTGDVLVVESGFRDVQDSIATADKEPSVLRMRVANYNAPGGQVAIGSWDAKVTLTPEKDAGDTLLERGQWSAWDSVNDRMYFLNPGGGSDTNNSSPVPFELDVTVLDLKVGSPTYGQTTTHLNVDESVSLFFQSPFEDAVDFFSLINADVDGNGLIDGNDILRVQRGMGVTPNALHAQGDANGDGKVDSQDLAIVAAAFPAALPPPAGAVPEPAVAPMIVVAVLVLGSRSRPGWRA